MNKFYGAHDQWTDLDKQNDVLITSTDGVIDSVKVNGEDYGGGGGSSDFSTAEVSFVTNLPSFNAVIYGSIMDVSSQIGYINPITAIARLEAEVVSDEKYTVVLYNGYGYVSLQSRVNVTTSGNATAEKYDTENNVWLITITGDCTITVKS